MINRGKGDYIKRKLEENESRPKRFWREINNIISPKADFSEHIRLVDRSTGAMRPNGTESDLINDYYASVGRNILLQNRSPFGWDHDMIRLAGGIIEFDEITEGEVLAEVEQIDTSKTSGIPFVSSLVLKIVLTVLISKRTYLYNLSVSTSKFPSIWGRSCVTPIPKGGDVKIVKFTW